MGPGDDDLLSSKAAVLSSLMDGEDCPPIQIWAQTKHISSYIIQGSVHRDLLEVESPLEGFCVA
jgi:hypothetical protein